MTIRKWLVIFFAGLVGLAAAICAQPAVSAVLNAASYVPVIVQIGDASTQPDAVWIAVTGN